MEESWRTILHQKISQELSKTTEKEQKNGKKIKQKAEKAKLVSIPWWKKCREMEESWRPILHKKISKELSKTTKKEPKNRKYREKNPKKRN